jgi:predicted NUDIX family NTP pyrophosphohydrolase
MARSAGVLVYRVVKTQLEFLLLRPGGPFYKNSDEGIWTIPKGEIQKDEDESEAAKREFHEETSFQLSNSIEYLDVFKLRKGKSLAVFTTSGDFDITKLVSNEFEMEYPKNSGQLEKFPEIQEGRWMTIEEAQLKISPKQLVILNRVIEKEQHP